MRCWVPARRTLAHSAGCSGRKSTRSGPLQTPAAPSRRTQPSARALPLANPAAGRAMGAALSAASTLLSPSVVTPAQSGVRTAATASAAPSADAGDADGMWLIVGLGNPGPRYDGTRHNVGFEVVDGLARAGGVKLDKLQEGAAVARCSVAGRRVVLAKPMTFMNNSGGPVRKLINFYKARRVADHGRCFEVATSVISKV